MAAAGGDVTQVVRSLDGINGAVGKNYAERDLGRPPLPLPVVKHSFSSASLVEEGIHKDSMERDVSRHPRPISLAKHSFSSMSLAEEDRAETSSMTQPECAELEFRPVFRSGSCTDIGKRISMEDQHVRIDDLIEHLGADLLDDASPGAFYGVFDGHNGGDAAQFVKENILQFIVDDVAFPSEVETALCRGFKKTDIAFARASEKYDTTSGTTAITVLLLGRNLFVANAGDCRAVLCRRGKVVEMSRDHKPHCDVERARIEALGGFVNDGYLNGQLGVARALGNWHMKLLNGLESPLSGEPELQHVVLSEADEFMIIGCDGLWDVFPNQSAVGFVRRRLQQHNDPELCCRELVEEALLRDTRDNLTVLVVCFHPAPPPSLAPRFRGVRRTISAEGIQSLQKFFSA